MNTRKINEVELPSDTELTLEMMFLARKTLSDLFIEQGKIKIDYKFINLAEPHVQQFIRDEIGYLQEEIFEAYSELELEKPITDDIHEEHADALHFWLEILLYSGIDYSDVKLYIGKLLEEKYPELARDNDPFQALCMSIRSGMINKGIELIYAGSSVKYVPINSVNDYNAILLESLSYLNIARNQLKNKYWKASTTKPNLELYHQKLLEGFLHYLGSLMIMGYDSRELAEIFLKKNIINHERAKGKW